MGVMTHMRAAFVRDGSIEVREVPRPVPGQGEILIQVDYAGVNRADLAQVKGAYPPPEGASEILGLEVSGTNVETGERVMALLAGGGYAQYVSVPAGQVLPIPDGLTGAEAASLPESLATAWSNLVDACQVKAGERVLIQGGSGSVGILACQLASLMGCEVIATAGSQERRDRLQSFGVQAIGHDEISELSDIDVALDIVGSDLDEIAKVMNTSGRIAVLAIQGGNRAEISVFRLMGRRLSIHGTTLRSRPVTEKAQILGDVWSFAEGYIRSGGLVPVVAEIIEVHGETDIARAHDVVARANPFGKVVLDLTSWNQP